MRSKCPSGVLPATFKLAARPVAIICVVTVIGLLLRLRGITWGLSHVYDPDESVLVDPAIRFVTTGDLNPHRFTYPGSSIQYPLGLAYAVYFVLGRLLGWFPTLQTFETLYWTDPTSFYLIARVLVVLLATVAIPTTYAIGRKVASETAALLAAGFVAVSPLHVEFSRVVRTDPAMTTFILLSTLLAMKAVERQLGRDFLLAGAFAGLATATKWPGIAGAAPILLATGLAAPGPPVSLAQRTRWLGVALAGLLVGFLVAAPFVPFEIGLVKQNLADEAGTHHLSATGSPGLSNYFWYLRGPLKTALGMPLELLALAGLIAVFADRVRFRLLMVSFSLLFFLGIGQLHLRWARWIVPLVPSLAILAAIGLEVVSRVLPVIRKRAVTQKACMFGLGVALVLPSAIDAFRQGMTLDTRDVGKAWFERHIPSDSRVAVEQYAPPISRSAYKVFIVEGGRLREDTTTRGWKHPLAGLPSLQPLRDRQIEYVLLADWFDRYQAERETYSTQVVLYKELFASSDLLYEVSPAGHIRGPVIRVLKFRR